MDSWLVVAAAAAGYLAKYWQNLSTNRNVFSEFSSLDSRSGNVETRKDPFRNSAWRRKLQEEVSDRKISNIYGLNVASAAEVDSASGFDSEKVGSLGNHTDCNVISLSSLAPGFSTNENLREDQCRKCPGADSSTNSAKPSITRMDTFNEPMRKISSLKTKYSSGHLLKPLSSIDSCLMAQLHMQHVIMEEYILSFIPSPATPIMRPLLITDGSGIISRASGDFSSGSNGTDGKGSKLHNQATFEKNGYAFAVPPLPKIDSLDPPKKLKFMRGNGCNERLSIPRENDTEKQFHSQWGPRDGKVLFCLGISIGIISSYIGNRREADKLRGLLKQTENLVQDLQEELEMKGSLTPKELANGNYESKDTYDNSFPDGATNSSSPKMDNPTRYDGKESYHQKVEQGSESMSKIEAELEAELERLGLNMNASNPGRRLPDLLDIDPDFVADFAEGELRSDVVNGQALVQSLSNEDRSGTSTTHSGIYAVSPRELSLRLHEVIQSRLQERVQELETALQNSQRKVKLMESEHKPNNGWKYPSTMESPLINEQLHCISKPLVMKLSGEAPDAYNEDESKEENAPCNINQINHQEKLHKFDESMSQSGWYAANISDETFDDQVRTLEEQLTSRVQELPDVDVSEDECSDCDDDDDDADDEMERLLIQQIVEKTKKGSPLLLNAQRILFSMDEI